MKANIQALNKAFESRIRLGIMSALMINAELDFITLRGLLDVTDGNLASHLKALEEAEYVSFTKTFVGRKTQTNYTATQAGKDAFRAHLEALESLIKTLD